MMKSSFKKLAFVMALAMVVSAMAPAATASAAEALGIVLQDDATWTVLETDEAEVGATVDYRYKGAPKNYKELDPTWASSDETVATVDKNGLVTTLKAGETVISISLSNGQKGEVTLTVGEIANTYTVKQINHNKVVLTFVESVDFTADDVTVNKLFDGEEVFWPIQNVKVAGNTIEFETYVNYEDGEEYIVRVGAEDEGTTYTTTIGDVTSVKLAYGTTKNALGDIVYPNKAYTNGEDGDDLTVYLSAQLYNKADVNVTKYYTTDDVVFDLAEDNEDIMLDNYSGEMTFYKVGVAGVITATYTYYDEEGVQHDIRSAATPVVSEKAPAYGIKKIDGWALVAEDEDNYWDINWNNHEIKAEDDARKGQYIVVKFTDTNGNQFITAPSDTFAALPWGMYYADDANYDFADKGNYLTFVSSNTNKLLVSEYDGEVTTADKAKVAVILSLHNYDSEKEDFFVKNVSAFQVNVAAKRKVSSVALNKNSTTVITASNEPGFTQTKVEAYVLDQYGDKWYENTSLKFSTTVEGAPAIENATYKAADGKAEFTVDGAWFTDLNKQTVNYTVQELKKYNTTTLKVVVKNPKYDATDIKVTSYTLSVGDTDMTGYDWDKWSTDDKTAKVNYFELSNSIEVGHKNNVTLIASAGALVIPEGTAAKGAQYVVIYDSNGNVVPASGSGVSVVNGQSAYVVEVQSGQYEVRVAEKNSNGIMSYAPTGTYTAKVLEIRDFNKGVAVFKTKYDKTFNVFNNNQYPVLKKQEKVDVSVTLAAADFEGKTYEQKMAAAIKKVVKEAFSMKLRGNDWGYAVGDIAKVDYKINEGTNSVIIRSVTFNVPLTSGNGCYQYKLTLNRAVDVELVKGQ